MATCVQSITPIMPGISGYFWANLNQNYSSKYVNKWIWCFLLPCSCITKLLLRFGKMNILLHNTWLVESVCHLFNCTANRRLTAIGVQVSTSYSLVASMGIKIKRYQDLKIEYLHMSHISKIFQWFINDIWFRTKHREWIELLPCFPSSKLHSWRDLPSMDLVLQ